MQSTFSYTFSASPLPSILSTLKYAFNILLVNSSYSNIISFQFSVLLPYLFTLPCSFHVKSLFRVHSTSNHSSVFLPCQFSGQETVRGSHHSVSLPCQFSGQETVRGNHHSVSLPCQFSGQENVRGSHHSVSLPCPFRVQENVRGSHHSVSLPCQFSGQKTVRGSHHSVSLPCQFSGQKPSMAYLRPLCTIRVCIS